MRSANGLWNLWATILAYVINIVRKYLFMAAADVPSWCVKCAAVGCEINGSWGRFY